MAFRGADVIVVRADGRGRPSAMTDVTRILFAIEQGDPHAAEQLLPLIYDELRKLAARRLAQEKPGQTLQATALVHEAYLRLVERDSAIPGAEGLSGLGRTDGDSPRVESAVLPRCR